MKRETFDSYLSSALGVKLKDGRLQDIDDSQYVLTLDYTVKVCHVQKDYAYYKVRQRKSMSNFIAVTVFAISLV